MSVVPEVQDHLRRTLSSIHDVPYFKDVRGPTDRADMDRVLREMIFRYLHFMISNKGEYLGIMFPGSQKEGQGDKFPHSFDEALNLHNASVFRDDPFYKFDESKVYHVYKHSGRNCGRKFKVGEPIYRCHECGYDETCVLCIHCFNPKDHDSHHVYIDICSEFSTGICDCGDTEAFVNPLHCKAEEDDSSESSREDDIFLSEEMGSLFQAVLTEVFDHFIDVFNQNIEPLPTLQKEITLKLREMTQQGRLSERAQLLSDLAYENEYLKPGMPAGDESIQELGYSEDLKNYTVIVYNDEYHNYSQATTALRQGVPDNKHTDLLASRIDSEGRATLKCSTELSAVMSGFFSVQTNGLSATLTSWSEYIHQEVCKYLILWLNHCLNIPNLKFQNGFRRAMGEVLCAPYDRASQAVNKTPVVRKYFPNKFNEADPYRYGDLSILAEGNKIPLGHHKELPISSTHYISATLNEVVSPTHRNYTNSRLQHILYFDNRYWKRLRKDVQNAIIPTLASNATYKPLFCRQVVEIFNHINRSVAFMDREPQLTALRECIVQLFTCPTNAMMIFKNGSFKDVMWSVIDIFVEFSKVEGGSLIWQRVQKSNPTKSYGVVFRQGLYAVETLLSKVTDCNIILKPAEFISVVTLCKLFNGAWKIKRKEGEHVLHEDQHFIPYLEYTTSIYSIIQTIEKVLEHSRDGIEEPLLLNAIRLLTTFLGNKTLTYKLVYDSHEIIKMEVSKQRVAFMNPVHTLYSFLIEKISLRKALEATQECTDFLKVSDFSLRSAVLCSQIDVGFWVRNGMSVLHQSSYYKNNPELSSYSRDIHLNQLAFLREDDDLPRVIYNMLDRWELLDWFSGVVDFDHTIYDDKIAAITQQFIAFVYQVLTERQFFKKFSSTKEKRMYYIKNALIYNLCIKPLSYSRLLRSVPDYLTEDAAELELALEEISDFVEPKGLADSGVFKLKESLFSKVDPLKLLNMENEFETTAKIIKAHLAKDKVTAARVVLQPQIMSPEDIDERAAELGKFTRNDVFAKLIYKLLQVCIDKQEGTFLYELLHLVHGIFKDEELYRGKESIPQAYLSKPICNLLLSIASSKADVFSEYVTRKADFLLESMILKRPAEVFDSLITSFGRQYVDDYKTRKMNHGVNLEEDEKARKKRLIKKRQEKLMAKFNIQQSKFMKENDFQLGGKDSGELDVDMDNKKVTEGEEFTCSLCQDNTSTDLFVIPAYHDQTPIFRSGNILNVKEFATPWHGFYNDDQKLIYDDDKVLENLEVNGVLGSRKVIVSCNHSIHHSCFKRYVQKKRFSTNAFICPLCQTFSNCVLPIRHVSKINTGLSIERLVNEEISVDVLARLLETFSAADFKNVYSTFNLVALHSHSYDKNARSLPGFQMADTAYILSVHWANTISMLEISARLDEPSRGSFLKNREQKYKTLKNTLICIILMCYSVGKPNPEFRPYENKDGIVWNQNQLFQYIVNKSLFSSEPFRETITHALTNYCKQLITEFIKGINPNDIEGMYNKATEFGELHEVQDTELLDTLKEVCVLGLSDPALSAKAYNLAYTSLLKNVLPTLRRCLVMLKCFHELVRGSEEDPFCVNGINFEEDQHLQPLPDYVNIVVSALTEFGSLQLLLAQGIPNMRPVEDTYLVDIPYEFCGIIKLIDLAKYLNTYVTNSKQIKLREEHWVRMKNVKNRLDYKICLTCGVKVHFRTDRQEMSKHLLKYCFKSFGAFLVPNSSEVCLFLSQPTSTVFISAPYLNSHGEAGKNAMRRGDLTTLNLKRYEYLNSLWINNEIPGYISRVMGDEFRVNILSNGFFFAFNRDPPPRRVPTTGNGSDEEDEDEADEAEFYNNRSSDEDERDVDMGENPLGGLFGGPEGGNVRGFLQVFENLQNAVGNGINPDDTQFAAPILQFFPPQFGGLNAQRDIGGGLNEDDEVLDEIPDQQDADENTD
ncbi:probable E3 ubiquitin-protein ligase UBR1 [Zygosaccharomyces bailii]|nr:probable E3 ubiquitin-protein ligase UBR1 [Zygosaccharomyces bailii]